MTPRCTCCCSESLSLHIEIMILKRSCGGLLVAYLRPPNADGTVRSITKGISAYQGKQLDFEVQNPEDNVCSETIGNLDKRIQKRLAQPLSTGAMPAAPGRHGALGGGKGSSKRQYPSTATKGWPTLQLYADSGITKQEINNARNQGDFERNLSHYKTAINEQIENELQEYMGQPDKDGNRTNINSHGRLTPAAKKNPAIKRARHLLVRDITMQDELDMSTYASAVNTQFKTAKAQAAGLLTKPPKITAPAVPLCADKNITDAKACNQALQDNWFGKVVYSPAQAPRPSWAPKAVDPKAALSPSI